MNLYARYRTGSESFRLMLEIMAVAENANSMTSYLTVGRHYASELGQSALQSELRGAFDRIKRLDEVVGGTQVRVMGGPDGAEPIIRAVWEAGRYPAATRALARTEPRTTTYYYGRDEYLARRLARRALYAHDLRELGRTVTSTYHSINWLEFVSAPLHAKFLEETSAELRAILFESFLSTNFKRWTPDPTLTDLVMRCGDDEYTTLTARCRVLALAGNTTEVLDLASRFEEPCAWAAALATLQAGDLKGAVKRWAAVIASERSGGRPLELNGPEGWFAPIAYWLYGTKSRSKQARNLVDAQERQLGTGFYEPLTRLERLTDGLAPGPNTGNTHPVGVLIDALVDYWTGQSLNTKALDTAIATAEPMSSWIANELRMLRDDDPSLAQAGTTALMTLREPQVAWERQLEALERALAPKGARRSKGGSQSSKRVAWFVNLWGQGHISVEARVQSRKGATWSAGRAVSAKRLSGAGKAVPEMDDADRRLASACFAEQHGGWGRYEVEYRWDWREAWKAMVDHPRIFAGDTGDAWEVVERAPEVSVEQRGKRLKLHVEPAPIKGLLVRETSPNRFEITDFTDIPELVINTLDGGMEVPVSARDRLAPLLTHLAQHFQVQDEAGASTAEDVPADSQLVVQLRPQGAGVLATLSVRPLGEAGPSFAPGIGPKAVLGEVSGRTCRAVRNLPDERQRAETLALAGPLAAELAGDATVATDGLEQTLELLESLQLADVSIEWPEGRALRVHPTRNAGLRINVSGSDEWFSATGALEINESLVLELHDLLDSLGDDRFVRLGDGEFLALTDDLRRRLAALGRVSKVSRGRLQVHRMAAPILEPVLESATATRLSAGWKEWIGHFNATRPPAEVPRTLEAELRPYQLTGFQWLVERTAIGAGLCLADDMGLGKTIQTLAFLLSRGAQGPALVVAPTSVCGNWELEAWRFAPTLNVHRFGPGDRAAMLAGLGPMDVVICSYGLVPTEGERLAEVSWSTLVLDEAQSIKNRETKRHKAIRLMKADARVALTGTPVENHLGDLWSLFEILNPGLLGSWKRFKERWATPVENGNRESAAQLRQLVLPFVLRRTKSAVLEDLPPRTDITIEVELSTEERAFYEALRRRALSALDTDSPSPVAVLAELTRLRLASCNARLIDQDVDVHVPQSAKLEAFSEIVEQLRAGGHRALVFSQFVKHLTLIREWLDAENIPYQYLDGSTPGATRDKRVRAFQAGEGDIFLISLKAGGTGLNLTGADYVIHMDPWWNPAVEDQASDRAHRIGQRRPVTVYRLVAKDTVEQRITALHHQKRALADRLLEGADTSTRLDAAALLELIRAE